MRQARGRVVEARVLRVARRVLETVALCAGAGLGGRGLRRRHGSARHGLWEGGGGG